MSLLKTFAQQPRAWILAEMVASLLAIGVLDFITGYEIRLLPFYGGPIFVVAWFCGKRLGILAAVFSGSFAVLFGPVTKFLALPHTQERLPK